MGDEAFDRLVADARTWASDRGSHGAVYVRALLARIESLRATVAALQARLNALSDMCIEQHGVGCRCPIRLAAAPSIPPSDDQP